MPQNILYLYPPATYPLGDESKLIVFKEDIVHEPFKVQACHHLFTICPFFLNLNKDRLLGFEVTDVALDIFQEYLVLNHD